ncbi:homeobox and leucine zipper protein Homez [Eublepharis macularius]|uniref:Homeobox and leucine zipper protein Homez n=1 Tax=Eublepharis macularius TaxID=481883 RepID=A0AA97LE26_EUBMA|nr:homeobox and leucine zipper protein Homez [Eublepharis macularius]XP_054851655.1 homeobox and leucine zipper protein Homez [Eublepharis macularius]XP_054851656.1 homeobox and leucine zipper protein Homez [Eublepharis macularius]
MPPNKDAPGFLGSPPNLICLPPISEDLQLVWTQAAQTSDLDGNQHLLQTFSYFPYPSLSDLALLCLRHGLHMEKVKAWFMAQRLRCGISWSAEEIEETRARLIYHQDQLHFSCLLAGSDGDSSHQAYKNQEYHQPAPVPLHHPIKYEEHQQECAVTSSSHCSTAQGTKGLGRISQDIWELRGNGLSHPRKAQENCRSSFHHNTKETFPTAYLPATTTSPDYKFHNSHTTVGGLAKASPQPSEPTPAAVNGRHHPANPPACSSVKATPSSSMAASDESPNPPNHQYPARDQQHVSGSFSDTLRKPRRKTKEQLDMLKSFFLHCQWARREDYHHLEQVTGLPRAEIIQWFGDTRYALKHGQLKWFRDNAGQSSEPFQSLPLHPLQAAHPDTRPLERYWAAHQQLQDNDLFLLCQESGMEAEQVMKWFHSRSPAPCEVEVCLDDEDEEDEEMAAAMLKEEDEDYEEEEDDVDEEDDEDWTM